MNFMELQDYNKDLDAGKVVRRLVKPGCRQRLRFDIEVAPLTATSGEVFINGEKVGELTYPTTSSGITKRLDLKPIQEAVIEAIYHVALTVEHQTND